MDVKSDACLAYNTEIVEWTESEVQIRLVFDDPLQVSRGLYNDEMTLRVADPSMFVSQLTGETLDEETASSGTKGSIPRQLPIGVVEEEI